MQDLNNMTLDVTEKIVIKAPIEKAFDALLLKLGPENTTPDNTPMPMVLEQWPGGRWFRDLGDDQGHLWGFVQVIKPPSLIEIHGPTFMSYAVAGHIQIRLSAVENGTELLVRHQALGAIEESHREGVVPGWRSMAEKVKSHAESL